MGSRSSASEGGLPHPDHLARDRQDCLAGPVDELPHPLGHCRNRRLLLLDRRAQADETGRDLLRGIVRVGHQRASDGDRQVKRRAVALDGEHDLLTRLCPNDIDDLEPVVVDDAVDGDHHITVTHTGSCGGALRVGVGAGGLHVAGNAGGHRRDGGGQRGDAEDMNRSKKQPHLELSMGLQRIPHFAQKKGEKVNKR